MSFKFRSAKDWGDIEQCIRNIHVREREEQQAASAERIDRIHCGPRKQEIDHAESPRDEQRIGFVESGVDENRRGVKSDDIDTT